MLANNQELFNKVFLTIAILLGAFCISSLFSRTLNSYCKTNPSLKPISGVLKLLTNLVIYAGAFIMIFDNLGVKIGPLLASLGISSLAVSLALVDVLKDVFSGIYILAERAIKIGDHILLSSGEEGRVSELGWRSVKLSIESGEIIIIPNSKFYQSIIMVKK